MKSGGTIDAMRQPRQQGTMDARDDNNRSFSTSSWLAVSEHSVWLRELFLPEALFARPAAARPADLVAAVGLRGPVRPS